MDRDALRQWLDERVASHEFSGVALVWRAGTPLFEYAGGIAHRGHGVPITTETRFGVASVTKMVTATTALRLVDRGELRLDQPLIEILPPEHRTKAMTAERTLHHSETVGLMSAISSWVFSRGSYEGSFRGELEKFARIAEREAPSPPG